MLLFINWQWLAEIWCQNRENKLVDSKNTVSDQHLLLASTFSLLRNCKNPKVSSWNPDASNKILIYKTSGNVEKCVFVTLVKLAFVFLGKQVSKLEHIVTALSIWQQKITNNLYITSLGWTEWTAICHSFEEGCVVTIHEENMEDN
jgi:hypothetical protein